MEALNAAITGVVLAEIWALIKYGFLVHLLIFFKHNLLRLGAFKCSHRCPIALDMAAAFVAAIAAAVVIACSKKGETIHHMQHALLDRVWDCN